MNDRTIPRQTVEVALTLSDGRTLTGEIQFDLDTRLSDFINELEPFIIVKTNDDSMRLVNKQHIIDIRMLQ